MHATHPHGERRDFRTLPPNLSEETTVDAYADTLAVQQDLTITDRVLGQHGMHVHEVTVPAQSRPFTSDMRLAAEILRQAFADLEDNAARIRDDADAWFESDNDATHSLLDVAEALHMDAENLRRASKDPDRRRAINERLRKEWNEGGRKSA